MVITNQQPQQVTIELSPNRSASWQHTKWIIIAIIFIVMIIATAWTFVGAWVVLPFAGIEAGLFALLMYKVSCSTYQKQVIFITSNKITVESGTRKRRTRIVFEKHESYFSYVESELDWELPKIILKAGSERIELGRFLNLTDRKLLKDALENANFCFVRNRWWQN